MDEGIKAGFVKPLPRTLFNLEEIEKAHRYMMTGKHIGKILLKIRNEEEEKQVVPEKKYFTANPRFYCVSQNSYIIVGGLGGVGLELADWLVLRGATKLVLVSRFGIQTGYQKRRMHFLEYYGVDIIVSIQDVTTKQGCINLIKEATKLGPIGGVFNLAVVLKDALFEEQTEDNFVVSLAPKAETTKYLDQVTRELCPDLRYFVVFSSVSCGRGNAGQSNYGMANSIMERICEERKKDGLPAVAIQWGAIGEVGLVAKMQKENKELVIGGTLQQKISSCLGVLDNLLNQDNPVVSSMLVAEKNNKNFGLLSAVEAVASVLGIKDMKTVSQHATLNELGMDSMAGTEIVQLLEKDFDIYVTTKEVRSLTFARLTDIEAEKKTNIDKTEIGTNMLLQDIPDSSTSHLHTITLPAHNQKNENVTVFVLPGIEGVFKPLETLTKQLKAHVIGLQYNYHNPEDSIEEVAKNLIPHIETNVSKDKHFLLVGYSFGAVVGLEVANLLEKNGYVGQLVLIDGSPSYSISSVKKIFPHETEAEFETAVMCWILTTLLPIEVVNQHKDKLLKCADLNDRIDFVLASIPPEVKNKDKLQKQAAITLNKRFKILLEYKFNNEKIKSTVHLFKAKSRMINEEDDYQLSKLCEKQVEVMEVDGNHATLINEAKLAHGVNSIISHM